MLVLSFLFLEGVDFVALSLGASFGLRHGSQLDFPCLVPVRQRSRYCTVATSGEFSAGKT